MMASGRRPRDTVTHHDLCFGCGLANLFGLQMEVERTAEGGVSGRFFVKQDHQGPPGIAHGGILGAALDEAMSLAIHAEGIYALTVRTEVELESPAPVGAFIELEAHIDRREGRKLWTSTTASAEGRTLARASALFVEQPPPDEAPGSGPED
jgi:acyl-coenzyme A thioesterase PaaI-like protein